MDDQAIWSIILENRPRVWRMLHDGRRWYRETACSVQDALDAGFEGVYESLRDQCFENTTIEVCISVVCDETDERATERRSLRL